MLTLKSRPLWRSENNIWQQKKSNIKVKSWNGTGILQTRSFIVIWLLRLASNAVRFSFRAGLTYINRFWIWVLMSGQKWLDSTMICFESCAEVVLKWMSNKSRKCVLLTSEASFTHLFCLCNNLRTCVFNVCTGGLCPPNIYIYVSPECSLEITIILVCLLSVNVFVVYKLYM